MAEFQCKYCGVELHGTKRQMCCHCYEKLPLVRQLQGMVRRAKEQVERANADEAPVLRYKNVRKGEEK